MKPYYSVSAARAPGQVQFSRAYDRFNDALGDAVSMLSHGAIAAWIVDRDGELVLPAHQVKLRQGPPDRRSEARSSRSARQENSWRQ